MTNKRKTERGRPELASERKSVIVQFRVTAAEGKALAQKALEGRKEKAFQIGSGKGAHGDMSAPLVESQGNSEGSLPIWSQRRVFSGFFRQSSVLRYLVHCDAHENHPELANCIQEQASAYMRSTPLPWEPMENMAVASLFPAGRSQNICSSPVHSQAWMPWRLCW